MRDTTQMLSLLDKRIVDNLYVEAMVLADEARSYFDSRADEHRPLLGSIGQMHFACESLKVTTRLMHVLAWLLTQRAIGAGELPTSVRQNPDYQLGEAAPTEADISSHFPPEMQALICASEDLYNRVGRLERQMVRPARLARAAPISPALGLMQRLEQAF